MSRKFAVIRYEVFEYPELPVMTFTSRGNGNELGYETEVYLTGCKCQRLFTSHHTRTS